MSKVPSITTAIARGVDALVNQGAGRRMSAAGLMLTAVVPAFAGPGQINVAPVGAAAVVSPTYYANSPAGVLATGSNSGTALRKFVDTLPGLGATAANNLGQYIPVATPEAWVSPNGKVTTDDYYELGVIEFSERQHSDLAKATLLRGFIQLSTPKNPGAKFPLTYSDGTPIYQRDAKGNYVVDAAGAKVQVLAYDKPHALGPLVIANSGRAVRFKVTNYLPSGHAEVDPLTGKIKLDAAGKPLRHGDLFLPVDRTLEGSGKAPDGKVNYSQNRVSVHLHGGDAPWISDGTPHQWFAPAGEADSTIPTSVANDLVASGSALPISHFLKGVSTIAVPDMPDPGPGSQTFYYPNRASARFIWYHDHTLGLTRVNAYSGIAAGYLITDTSEANLVSTGAIPATQIPLVIQEKTYVPLDIARQDANWDVNAWGQPGDLWFPHVYESNGLTNLSNNGFTAAAAALKAADPLGIGANPAGRWDYGPELGLVGTFPALLTGKYGAVVADPLTGMINAPTTTPEAYMDTPLINGTAYPSLSVEPKAYRFRLLNAANDRYVNLSLFVAQPAIDPTTGVAMLDAAGLPILSEVAMVPAIQPTGLPLCVPTAVINPATGLPADAIAATPLCWPTTWPAGVLDPLTNTIVADPLKLGGVPDPKTAGPQIVQIGSEAGFLPSPRHIAAAPTLYDGAQTAGNGMALNNIGSHALFMVSGERSDIVVDFSAYAGKTLILYNDAPAPAPGFDSRYDYYTANADQSSAGGQEATKPGYGPNTRTLMQIKVAATLAGGGAPVAFNFANTDTGIATAYTARNEPPLVDINTAAAELTANRAAPTLMADVAGANPALAIAPVINPVAVLGKAIVEEFDPNFGRLNAIFGVTTPLGNKGQAYVDRPTEVLRQDETTLWRIAHTGVDAHPIHFHLVNVQVVARVNANGTVLKPDPEEMGWKEIVRMNPAQDTIVAIRAKRPVLDGFSVPLSTRQLDPSQPIGVATGFTQMDPATGLAPATPLLNDIYAYGWEYVWHCHILGHEENDFMRSVNFLPTEVAPLAPTLTATATSQTVLPVKINILDNANNEYAYRVERSEIDPATGAVISPMALVDTLIASTGTGYATVWTDPTAVVDKRYAYQISAVGAATVFVANVATGLKEAVSSSTINVDTGAVPAASASLTTSAITARALTLTWAPITGVLSYQVEQSADNGLTWTTLNAAIPSTATTLAVANLLPSANYLFRVSAANKFGQSANYATTTATTAVELLTPNVSAATSSVTNPATGAAQVTINWTDASTGKTAFKVERCLGTTATCAAPTAVWTSLSSTIAPTATSYSDTTAAANSTYVYRVSALATNAAGVTTTGTTASVQATSATWVASPSNLNGTMVGTAVNLNWTDTSNNETSFLIERATVTAGAAGTYATVGTITRAAADTTATGGLVTYSDATIVVGTTYSYRVTAVNTAGAAVTNSLSALFSANTAAPLAPATLTSSLVTARTLTLTWAAVTGAASYKVEQSIDNGLTWTVTNAAVASPTVTLALTALTPATKYQFRVSSVTAAVQSIGFATTAITTPAELLAPTMGAASSVVFDTATGASQVTLNWTDTSTGETGYKVERCAGKNCTATSVWTTIAAGLPANSVTYIDTTAASGAAYVYRVTAFETNATTKVTTLGAASTVALTAAAVIVAPSALVATTTGANVTLTWTDGSTNETAFSVERASVTGGVTGPFAAIGTVARTGTATTSTGTAVTFADATAVAGTDYAYQVKAQVISGVAPNQMTVSSLPSNVAMLSMTMPAPTGLTATASATGITLGFTDTSSNETGFEVWRSTDGVNYGAAALATVARTATQGTSVNVAVSYIDTSAAPGQTYYYQVRAVKSAVAPALPIYSTFSAPASASTTIAAASSLTVSLGTASATAQPILLSWIDNANNETQYSVERATVTGGAAGAWAPLATKVTRTAAQGTSVAGAVAYTDSTALLNTSYAYRVVAQRVVGTGATALTYSSLPSNEAWTTGVVATTAPGTLSANTSSGTSVVLSWVDNSINETGFQVNRSADGGVTWALVTTVARTGTLTTGKGTVVSYTDATAVIGTSYQYQVVAVMPTGNLSSGIVSASLPLNPPTAASVTVVATGLQVGWIDNSTNETSFEVVRTQPATPAAAAVITTVASSATQKKATGTARSWIDTTAVAGIRYSYVVRAVNLTGAVTVRSTDSNAATGVLLLASPSTPTVTIKSATALSVVFADLSTNETGFVVERAITPVGGTQGAWTALPTVTRTAAQSTAVNSAVSVTDTLVAPVVQGTYQYRVTAVNQTGAGATAVTNATSATVYSTQIAFTAPNPVVNVTATAATGTAGAVNVTWTDQTVNNETGFSVQFSTTATFTAATTTSTVVPGATAGTGVTGTYTKTGLVTGTTYYVRVAATNKIGASAYTAAAGTVVAP